MWGIARQFVNGFILCTIPTGSRKCCSSFICVCAETPNDIVKLIQPNPGQTWRNEAYSNGMGCSGKNRSGVDIFV